MKIIEVKERKENLINQLLEVWEDSVKATHTFLSNEEIENIKKYVPKALKCISHLIILENEKYQPIAFMGIEENKLEMLFIKNTERGKGLGKQLLSYGIENYGVNDLAVNEDNPQAKKFYEHMGFKVYQRNELDDQGNPYPVLYMRLESVMIYKYKYQSPNNFSDILMNSDGKYLTGLWFEGSRDMNKHEINCEEKELPIFKETSKWLDIYFSGKEPYFTPEYKINNLTPFRKEVIDIMNNIPFGKTLTYNDISKMITKNRGIKRMSSQAVGGAVGWNPICIIIPCHRVVGTNGSLTGYGGGIKNKVELLKLEGNDMSKFFIPKRGTAL